MGGADQPLKLDSRKPTIPLEQFTMKEGRYAMLAQADPARAKQLSKSAQADADAALEQLRGQRVQAHAAPDHVLVVGSGGENCDLPNLADQINPAQGAGNYQRISIDRGCSPIQVMPFGFQLHYARYVDPETGAESKLILVPSDQVLGWKDSYSQWSLDLLNPLNARNDPAKPALVMCAHDGDNAWGDIVRWTHDVTLIAEEKGITQANVAEVMGSSTDPEVRRFLGVEDKMGEGTSLTPRLRSTRASSSPQ